MPHQLQHQDIRTSNRPSIPQRCINSGWPVASHYCIAEAHSAHFYGMLVEGIEAQPHVNSGANLKLISAMKGRDVLHAVNFL